MEAPTRTIKDLDKESLQHIFSHLDLLDKLKLALVSNNITDLIKDALRNETLDVFDVQTTFSVPEAEFILANYGQFVTKYRYVSTWEDEIDFLRLIPKYCLNLEEIVLSRREIKPNDVHGQLLTVSKHVKALTLRKCILGNASCSLLSGLSNLEVLNLEDSKLTGKDFNKLRNLVDLNLKNCRNFKSRNFIEICKSNKLKKLNIAGLKQLTHASIQTLVDTQSDLETLIVGNKYWFKDWNRMFQLKSLREVSMIGCFELNVKANLEVLVDEQKETLECLEINFENSYPERGVDFLEREVLSRICEFSNLKVLSLRNSELLEDKHLVRIAKMCKLLEMLDIHGTAFRDMGIIKSVEHLERLHYLDISYCRVKRTLYSHLVEVRREQGINQQLLVYINSRMELKNLLASDEYKLCHHFVILLLDPMRLNNGISILERLRQLNTNNSETHQSKEILRPSSPDASEILQQKVTLLSLDENALYHIMKYLRVPKKLELVLISEHFCNVVRHFLHKDFVDFIDIITTFTAKETHEILSRCGFMVKRLRIKVPNSQPKDAEYYDLIAEFCTNLEELNCSNMFNVCKLVSIIRASSSTLKFLNLYHCEIDESVEIEISKASNLKTLWVKETGIVGSHVRQLKNLVDLDLGWCLKLEPQHFIAICKNNRLEKLGISKCTALNNEAFSVLSETQYNLQKIILDGIYEASNVVDIANLPNLVDVRLNGSSPQELIECLNALIEHRVDEIQCLQIQCLEDPEASILPKLRRSILEFANLKLLRLPFGTFINDTCLKQIAWLCPLLEILDLYNISNLTKEAIIYAVTHLKHLQHLNIKGCQIDDILALYQEVLTIKVQQMDAECLVLHVDSDCESLTETKEYAVMKKYVTLSTKDLSDLEKEGYFKKKKGKYQKEVKSTVFNTDFINNQDYVNILDLPTNCLLNIATYLGTVDKLNFISAHSRFLDSTRSLIECMVFNVNEISQSFTLREAQDLFKRCGKSIKRIQFTALNSNYVEYLRLIQPYREHFTEIHLSNISEQTNVEEHKKLFDSPLQRLKKIVFDNVEGIDAFLTVIQNKDDLQILDTSCYNGDGMLINQFKNLTELSLLNFVPTRLSSHSLIQICRNCKLKILDVHAFELLTLEAFNVLIETQSDTLERLSISCEYDDDVCSDVVKLPNLKHIFIQFYTNISLLEKVLDKLVKYHRNDLISLEVTNDMYVLPASADMLIETVHERSKKFSNLQKLAINVSPSLQYE
ncbi:uncharacterized protein LOC119650396 [Hermetia illucens]|uniref:uncharacterized protein LOC119650396 n=1 Tax=Hermetia illucens TaxID=343691 RepID=UPI0018CC1FAB|nr:uncharacterized protein LOC119650396 [Hermetia illucens]